MWSGGTHLLLGRLHGLREFKIKKSVNPLFNTAGLLAGAFALKQMKFRLKTIQREHRLEL
jgi:hypothetical protein